MSTALYRLGRSAARHPWRVIGAWLLATVAVIGLSSAFGQDLDDALTEPGLDSQEAIDLLSEVENCIQVLAPIAISRSMVNIVIRKI